MNPHISVTQRIAIYRVDAATLAAARTFWYAIKPEFHQITARFYVHLQANPDTARFLPAEHMIERLRAAQTAHWEALFTGELGDSYVRQVTSAAEAHIRIRLPNFHYMAAYAFFLNELVAGAHRLFRDDADQLMQVVAAINKLVLIDMDLTVSLYMQRLIRVGKSDIVPAEIPVQENA